MSFNFSVPTNALFGAGKLGELRMKIALQFIRNLISKT